MAPKAFFTLFMAFNLLVLGMPSPADAATCPRDALQLAACVNVLNVVKLQVGSPPVQPCCSLLQGLVDAEAAVCLCTVIKGNVLGVQLNVPVDLSLVLNNCGRDPNSFTCP
ncbi:unnamed protein product [Urochloa decumbens]|uniref:Bifunctional inhibitor/plant lipid transfer protein/seed storage helical domain-containing protein n=1 Tax=Urochloa decumbens TaxID=240449 RepID=A0ABC8V943_9POAL